MQLSFLGEKELDACIPVDEKMFMSTRGGFPMFSLSLSLFLCCLYQHSHSSGAYSKPGWIPSAHSTLHRKQEGPPPTPPSHVFFLHSQWLFVCSLQPETQTLILEKLIHMFASNGYNYFIVHPLHFLTQFIRDLNKFSEQVQVPCTLMLLLSLITLILDVCHQTSRVCDHRPQFHP